jgi:hypothetical protein
MPRDTTRVRSPKRTAPARYRRLTVSWHTTVDGRFDPVANLTALAQSLGLVVRVGKSQTPDRGSIRVDTVDSSPVVSPEEKERRKGAIKSFQKLVRANPKLAAKLATMSPEQIAQLLSGKP